MLTNHTPISATLTNHTPIPTNFWLSIIDNIIQYTHLSSTHIQWTITAAKYTHGVASSKTIIRPYRIRLSYCNTPNYWRKINGKWQRSKTDWIYIAEKLLNTILHELGHIWDWENGNMSKYYQLEKSMQKGKFRRINWKNRPCEQSAEKYVSEMMSIHNFEDIILDIAIELEKCPKRRIDY